MEDLRKRFEATQKAQRESKSGFSFFQPVSQISSSTPAIAVAVKPPSSNSIASHIDSFKMPQAKKAPQKRERMFEIRQVPQSTVDFTLDAIKEVHPNADAAIANAKLFEEFEEKNDRPRGTLTRDFLFVLFIVDITLQGLGLTSARTYGRGILGVVSRAGRPIDGPFVADAFKILELLIAGEEVDHAKDLDLPTALEILRLLTGQAQVMVWLMITTGARAKDLLRMKRKQFRFSCVDGVAYLDVHFRYTKNRHTEVRQYVLHVALTDDIPIPRQVLDHFNSISSEAPIIHLGCDAVNKAIDALGPFFALYTSYSFRRLFVHRAIEKFKDDEGHIAWAEVVKLTGHIRIETLRTSYAKPFDRVL